MPDLDELLSFFSLGSRNLSRLIWTLMLSLLDFLVGWADGVRSLLLTFDELLREVDSSVVTLKLARVLLLFDGLGVTIFKDWMVGSSSSSSVLLLFLTWHVDPDSGMVVVLTELGTVVDALDGWPSFFLWFGRRGSSETKVSSRFNFLFALVCSRDVRLFLLPRISLETSPSLFSVNTWACPLESVRVWWPGVVGELLEPEEGGVTSEAISDSLSRGGLIFCSANSFALHLSNSGTYASSSSSSSSSQPPTVVAGESTQRL